MAAKATLQTIIEMSLEFELFGNFALFGCGIRKKNFFF